MLQLQLQQLNCLNFFPISGKLLFRKSHETLDSYSVFLHLANNFSFQTAFDAVGQLIEQKLKGLNVSESIFQAKSNGAI